MSLRIYPLSVSESALRALAATPASERCAIAKAGAGEVWPLSEEFSEGVYSAAERIFDGTPPPESAGEAAVAAVVGLALAGAKGERLTGEIDDWKAAALEDFAAWASDRFSPAAAAILSALAAGRALDGGPRPGAGEPRYTLLTAAETGLLTNDLTQLTEDGGLEEAGELVEFALDLLGWCEGCSGDEDSLLIGIL